MDLQDTESSPASTDMPTQSSQWKTTDAVPLTRESFLDLLDGKTPLIKEAGFISTEACKLLAAELMPKLCPYIHATGPAVHKVGLAQFEFQAQSQEDFKTRTGAGQICTPCFLRLKIGY